MEVIKKRDRVDVDIDASGDLSIYQAIPDGMSQEIRIHADDIAKFLDGLNAVIAGAKP